MENASLGRGFIGSVCNLQKYSIGPKYYMQSSLNLKYIYKIYCVSFHNKMYLQVAMYQTEPLCSDLNIALLIEK